MGIGDWDSYCLICIAYSMLLLSLEQKQFLICWFHSNIRKDPHWLIHLVEANAMFVFHTVSFLNKNYFLFSPLLLWVSYRFKIWLSTHLHKKTSVYSNTSAQLLQTTSWNVTLPFPVCMLDIVHVSCFCCVTFHGQLFQDCS